MQGMFFLYNTLMGGKKERFDIILEPLQAILQLALLSFAPIESKLTINNNILYIQPPTWRQGVIRSYYHDSKNDLFYLFNVFIRFNKFYQCLKKIHNNDNSSLNLFTLLKELATKGIDNLLQTYKQTDNPALLHTLNIYKNLLNNPEQQLSAQQLTTQQLSTQQSSDKSDTEEHFETERQYQYQSNNIWSYEIQSRTPNEPNDIDSVFKNIITLYTDYDLIIIFNTLQLIVKSPTNYLDYTDGLNKVLEPINKQIQKWIVDNIVY